MPLTLKIVLVVAALTAGAFDLRYRRIPNWLNLAALILGVGLNAGLGGWHGFTTSLAGAGLALLVYLPLYLLRGMGAGDVKLMFAVGAIAGPAQWLDIFFGTALIGALIGIGLAVVKGKLGHTLLNSQYLVTELAHFRLPHGTAPELDVRNPEALRLPHGVAIALGSVVTLMLPVVVPGLAS